jgi:putative transposase
MSERRACRLVGLTRSSWRKPPQHDQSTLALKVRIKELAHERKRFGYRRIHDMLRFEGVHVNHKRVYRFDLPPIKLPVFIEKSPFKNHFTCLSLCA